jgi:hypothetical protein
MARRKQSDKLRDMETPMVLGIELDRATLTPRKHFFKPDPPKPEPVLGPMAGPDLPMDPRPESGLLSDIGSLSSGQLASLTGERDYTKLDTIHADLVAFYLLSHSRAWKTWVDVWNAFQRRNSK